MESREVLTEVESARRALRSFDPKLKATWGARVRADVFDSIQGRLPLDGLPGAPELVANIEGVLCWRAAGLDTPVEFYEL